MQPGSSPRERMSSEKLVIVASDFSSREETTVLATVEESVRHEPVDRLADGDTRNPEHLAEDPLAGNDGTAPDMRGGDRLLQGIGQLPVERLVAPVGKLSGEEVEDRSVGHGKRTPCGESPSKIFPDVKLVLASCNGFRHYDEGRGAWPTEDAE